MEGQVIAGRYAIGDRLGAGGMGIVYQGIDTSTGEKIAIKHLRPDVIADDASLLTRFQREGEILRQLNHPNIVRMFTALQDADNHYLIMELIETGSLDTLLKSETPPSITRCLKIALELTDALTRAHHLNIIHRDIKPANVLIAADGTPRLTDFGIAHHRSDQQFAEEGIAVGTLDYLSPEVIRGELVDARADIWSFGVMLFELLAGKPPFDGYSLTAVMLAILQDPIPDLEALRPDAPVGLIDLIYRMLAKDRNQRIASMRLVGAALEALLNNAEDEIFKQAVQFQVALEASGKLLATPPSSTGLKVRRHNFPAQGTPFIGRETELDHLVHLLESDQTRFITIQGPGGMGKTRLALELAERILDPTEASQHARYAPTRAYLVELAPLTSPDQLVSRLAEALEFRFSPGSEPQDQLLTYLRDKTFLLVLDNFEHLLAKADFVSEILKTAPEVKIIVTSRERLNLQSETLFNITGLDMPETTTLEQAKQYSSILLFIDSARRIQPDFELMAENLTAVLRICKLVQGMPLGIILAAAWLKMLTPAEIATEIENSLDFLATELRDIPTRQRSIRAVFDYSWNMLTEAERSTFMNLAVFRGGFTREAAQTVAGASLRTLMALVNKSLLRRDNVSGRYEIHELLRQYAEQRLHDAGAAASISQQHGEYYLQFLQQRDPDLKSGRQLTALQEIDADFQNIRLAWLAMLQLPPTEANANRFASAVDALGMYCDRKAKYIEGEYLLRQAQAGIDGQLYPRQSLKIRVRYTWFYLVSDLPRPATLQADIERDLAQARTIDDGWLIALGLVNLGSVTYYQPEGPLKGLRLLQEATELFRAAGDHYHYADSLTIFALCNRDPVLRRQYLKEAIAMTDAIGAWNLKSWALLHLGSYSYLPFNEIDLAEATLSEALALQQKLGDKKPMLWTIFIINIIHIYQGEFERVKAAVADYIPVAVSVNYLTWTAQAKAYLGLIAVIQDEAYEQGKQLSQETFETQGAWNPALFSAHCAFTIAETALGHYEAAREHLKAQLEIARTEPGTNYTIFCILAGIGLLSALDQQAGAVSLWAYVLAHPAYPRQLIENWKLLNRQVARLQAELPADAYAAALERGQTLTVPEIMDMLAAL